MNIVLDTDRGVIMRGVYMGHTYAGLIEGRPDDDLNRKFREACVEYVREALGDALPLVTLEPELKEILRALWMPRMYVAVELERASAGAHSDEASGLLLMWFTSEDDVIGRPIAAQVREAMREVDWEREARDVGPRR